MKFFYNHLKPGGFISFDFMEDDGKYNKEKTRESMSQREETLKFVQDNFTIVKTNGIWFVQKI